MRKLKFQLQYKLCGNFYRRFKIKTRAYSNANLSKLQNKQKLRKQPDEEIEPFIAWYIQTLIKHQLLIYRILIIFFQFSNLNVLSEHFTSCLTIPQFSTHCDIGEYSRPQFIFVRLSTTMYDKLEISNKTFQRAFARTNKGPVVILK